MFGLDFCLSTVNIDGAFNIPNGTIFSTIEPSGVGDGGTVTINSGSLALTDGGQIQTLVREKEENTPAGQGNAGNILIDVKEDVFLSGTSNDESQFPSKLVSSLETGAEGSAGDIEVKASSLTLENEAEINSSTSGTGNAGNITLNIDGAFNIPNGTIFSTIEPSGVGDGGTVTINSGSLALTDGGQIQTLVREGEEDTPAGQGNAGTVLIDVNGEVNVSGKDDNDNFSAIFSSLETGAKGSAGDISVTADSLALDDGADNSKRSWKLRNS